MIDNNIKIMKEEAKVYPPLPVNIYQVELLDITSEESETYDSKKGKTESKEYETIFKFQYVLLSGKEGDDDLRGRSVWHNFVKSYLYIGKNGKNDLYQIVEAFLGRELTPKEDAEGIDGAFLNALIGKQCRIGTKHKSSADGTKVYDNVDTYYVSEEDKEALTAEEKENSRVKKDKDDTNKVEAKASKDVKAFNQSEGEILEDALVDELDK